MYAPHSVQLIYVSLCRTHIEDGDDGGVIPADYSGDVLRLGDLRGDQLKVKEKQKRQRKDLLSEGKRGKEGERGGGGDNKGMEELQLNEGGKEERTNSITSSCPQGKVQLYKKCTVDNTFDFRG